MTFDEQRGEEGTSQARHSVVYYIRLLCIGQEGSQNQGWLIYIHVEDPVKRVAMYRGSPPNICFGTVKRHEC